MRIQIMEALDRAEIRDYFKDYGDEEFLDAFRNVIEIGISVISRIETSRDTEVVKKEFELMTAKFQAFVDKLQTNTVNQIVQSINESFSPDLDTSYLKRTSAFMREKLQSVSNEIKIVVENAVKVSAESVKVQKDGIQAVEVNFNPAIATSYLGKMNSTLQDATQKINALLDGNVRDSFASKLTELTEKQFGAQSPIVGTITNLLNEFSAGINKEIVTLREEIARKEGGDAMLESASKKGFIFEDELDEKLQSIAAQYGDTVEKTGKDTNASTSKKGDFIYNYAEGRSIVIEAKDESIGVKPMIKYLDEAMQNREVEFAILVTKHENQLQKQVGMFNLYDGNKLFVPEEYLEFALRWIRIYLTTVKSKAVEGIDKTQALKCLGTIQASLVNFKSIKQKLTVLSSNINTAVSAVGVSLDEVKIQIESQLTELEEMINKE